MGSTEFEREIQHLIELAEAEQQRAQRRIDAAQEAFAAAAKRVKSHQETLGVYREEHGLKQDDTSGQIDEDVRQRFSDKSIKEALILIGEDNNGLIEGAAAGRILVKAGWYANTDAASGSVYSGLTRYPKVFEKVARGKYRLHQNTKPKPVNGVAKSAEEKMRRGVAAVDTTVLNRAGEELQRSLATIDTSALNEAGVQMRRNLAALDASALNTIGEQMRHNLAALNASALNTVGEQMRSTLAGLDISALSTVSDQMRSTLAGLDVGGLSGAAR